MSKGRNKNGHHNLRIICIKKSQKIIYSQVFDILLCIQYFYAERRRNQYHTFQLKYINVYLSCSIKIQAI